MFMLTSSFAQRFKFEVHETDGKDYEVVINVPSKYIWIYNNDKVELSCLFSKFRIDKEKDIIGFSFSQNSDVIMRPDHSQHYFLIRRDAIFCSNSDATQEYFMKPVHVATYNETFNQLKEWLDASIKGIEVNGSNHFELENHSIGIPEIGPEFPGGMDALSQYLNRNIRYPSCALENNIQGRVVLKFIVRVDGSISNIEIVKSLDPECDKEAIRVVSSMPKWKPGKLNGKPVSCHFTCPVIFRLQ